jgi:hypothetical protein
MDVQGRHDRPAAAGGCEEIRDIHHLQQDQEIGLRHHCPKVTTGLLVWRILYGFSGFIKILFLSAITLLLDEQGPES